MDRTKYKGVSLASIVAKETTHGEFSGTGGGVGVGLGGLGAFVGGVNGTTRQQTERAKNFEIGSKPYFSLLNVYKPIIAACGVAVLFFFNLKMIPLISNLGTNDTPNADPLSGFLDLLINTILGFLPYAFSILAGLYLIHWGFWGYKDSVKHELLRLKNESKNYGMVSKVYQRLRFYEDEFIVYDPVTKRECPALQDNILSMIDDIIEDEQFIKHN